MPVCPYRHEAVRAFRTLEEQNAMRQALGEVKTRLGRHFPLKIGGQPIETGVRLSSQDPSQPDRVVGTVCLATAAHADRALDCAWRAFASWRRLSAAERARYLWRAAAVMRRRRLELAAWEVFEAGKPWTEADADVAEAIDFLEFYARAAVDLEASIPLVPLPDEEDAAFYEPLGAGVILPPWNFPLAIVTGMVAGAVVTGNTVVVKPSSLTPVMGALLLEVLENAGVPDGVVNYLPGDGSSIGEYLVTHPRTRFVAFTGSREIGIRIHRLAAEVPTGQRWLKRVVAEMGGKDAVVVDETADLDRAVAAIVPSAFGYQGQKCSACSRVIAVEAVYPALVERLVERVEALTVGPAESNPDLGPVIDGRALDKIEAYIREGEQQAVLLTGGQRAPGAGFFLRPTIFGEVLPTSVLAQDEIFGPVLSLLRVRDWSEALEVANGTPYGLTGAVFSRRGDRIEEARREFAVGNLYINRGCTGAIVGAHPFGGFFLSGTDAKTGSHDYLRWFLQMKAVAERF